MINCRDILALREAGVFEKAEFLWESKSTKNVESSFWGKYQVHVTISAIENRKIRRRWNATTSDQSQMY